jgi:hypothetical protein
VAQSSRRRHAFEQEHTGHNTAPADDELPGRKGKGRCIGGKALQEDGAGRPGHCREEGQKQPDGDLARDDQWPAERDQSRESKRERENAPSVEALTEHEAGENRGPDRHCPDNDRDPSRRSGELRMRDQDIGCRDCKHGWHRDTRTNARA